MKIRLRNTIILLFFVTMTNIMCASVIENVRSLMEAGDYEMALSLVVEELKEKQKPAILAELNLSAGKCSFNMGNYDEAVKYFEAAKSRYPEAYRYLGKINFLNYDFDASEELYDMYYEQMKKSKKEVDENGTIERSRLQMAQSMIERVEQITIIDSLSVAKDGFYKFYRIAESSGRLKDMAQLPFQVECVSENLPFYTNENEEFVIYSQTDSLGRLYLEESSHLIDGTWQESIAVDFGADLGGDVAYPFMMSDGATLYFSNDGMESIGGYDIFRSNRDVETHEYMSPQNIGMPYNSPYNDYMLAIDEENGVGWWATDRNAPGSDVVTIYLFITNDVRINRNIDDAMIADYAMVSIYKATWEDEADYSEILHTINQIDPNKPKRKVEFDFAIGNGVVYQNYDDFKSDDGRNLMMLYVEKTAEFEQKMNELSELRFDYKNRPTTVLIVEIEKYEKMVESLHKEILEIKNKIYKVEK